MSGDRSAAMLALLTRDGTATAETATCGDCAVHPHAVIAARRCSDQDVPGDAEFIDCSDNPELQCQSCGRRR